VQREKQIMLSSSFLGLLDRLVGMLLKDAYVISEIKNNGKVPMAVNGMK
jgi:hypothetical protein